MDGLDRARHSPRGPSSARTVAAEMAFIDDLRFKKKGSISRKSRQKR